MNMQIQNQNNENKIAQLMNSIEYIKNSLNLNNKNNNNNNLNDNKMINNNNANNNINLNMLNDLMHKTQIIKKKFNNNNQIEKNKNSNKEYPHKIGLENLGQNGYLNTSLHCLTNIKSLSEKLLNNSSYLNQNTQQLAFAYTNLLYELNNSNSQYINPSNINSIIGELNLLFKRNHNSDPKDLLFFMIERLHQELKQKMDINLQLQELTSENKDLALQNFFNDLKYNKSYLLDTFYGILETKLKCDKCNTIKYSYQTFNMTVFNLKNVKEDKINSIGLENYNGINIFDCFENFRKVEILIGDKKIYCNICQSWNTGTFQKNIFNSRPVLIIVLNRGKNNQDFKEDFSFPEVINFKKNNYVINDKSYKKYFLCSIITCLRENSSNEHFVCYCRNNLNEKFVCYDDINVSKNIEIDDAMNYKFFGNYNDKRTPYILFYHYF
jgi:ubiquitin carboxyl-terminal hydrolase 8